MAPVAARSNPSADTSDPAVGPMDIGNGVQRGESAPTEHLAMDTGTGEAAAEAAIRSIDASGSATGNGESVIEFD